MLLILMKMCSICHISHFNYTWTCNLPSCVTPGALHLISIRAFHGLHTASCSFSCILCFRHYLFPVFIHTLSGEYMSIICRLFSRHRIKTFNYIFANLMFALLATNNCKIFLPLLNAHKKWKAQLGTIWCDVLALLCCCLRVSQTNL